MFRDATTGFVFSQFQAAYKIGGYINFRIAVPNDAKANESYDAVVQVVAPLEVGWAGLAWGGSMVNSPLTLSWQNGQSVVGSSRYTS